MVAVEYRQWCDRLQDLGFRPTIPIIDAPDGPLQLARPEPATLKYLLKLTHETLPAPLLRWGDHISERWLRKSTSPYVGEIRDVAALLGEPGAYALNLNFEWGCTTACRTDEGRSPGIYRTFDWPFRLGGDVVVARHRTGVGRYYNVTWPGFMGVLTAVAPGRFAAAINQAPMIYTCREFGLTLPVDWIVNRWRVRKQTAVPLAHLLRAVFDKCASYEEAKTALATTPICIPALFTLAGPIQVKPALWNDASGMPSFTTARVSSPIIGSIENSRGAPGRYATMTAAPSCPNCWRRSMANSTGWCLRCSMPIRD